jgi:hypothetical protein
MKKTYISPKALMVELRAKRPMLISVSNSKAATDATVYGRESSFEDEE